MTNLSTMPLRSRRLARGASRARRDAKSARDHILAAAERVFAVSLPDAVGIKDVAREAGVSRTLVIHYFGTYETLIDEVLERRVGSLRDELVGELLRVFANTGTGFDLLREHRKIVAKATRDPVTSRLVAWALVTQRFRLRALPASAQGLKLLADAIELRGGLNVDRSALEFVLAAETALTIAWTHARPLLLAALGRDDSDPAFSEDAVNERLRDFVEGYLRNHPKAPGNP
jgi:AcrR family transcriptional regulator